MTQDEDHSDGSDGPRRAAPDRKSYKAFISYSHAADGRLAPALRDGLHRFARPMFRLRTMRVFLDMSSMSANPGLWSTITGVLEKAEFLILLASPKAAASPWVRREVAWWLEHKSAKNILIALTDGTVAWDRQQGDFDWKTTNAIPPELKGAFSEEPRYIDLSWAKTAPRLLLSEPRFKDDVADFASFLLDRQKDDLLGADVDQHRRLLRMAGSAVVALLVLLLGAVTAALVAVSNGNDARSQRDRARAQTRLALSRQLAAESTVERTDRLDRALLLGIEAVDTQATPEARTSLLGALSSNPQLVSSRAVPAAGVTSLAFDAGRHRLAWGSAEGVVLWDTRDGTASTLSGVANVTQVAVSPTGVIAGSGKDTTMLWDPNRLQPTGPALSAAGRLQFNVDGTVLAVLGPSAVTFWDVATAQQSGAAVTLDRGGASGRCQAVAMSPDLSRLAFAASKACTDVVLWDVPRGAPIGKPLNGHREDVTDVAFSPDGRTLASSSGVPPSNDGLRGSIRLWDVERALARGEPLVKEGSSFTDLAFSPDGRVVAAATLTTRGIRGIDGVVTVVDGQTGAAVGAPLRSNGQVSAIAFGPGRTMASIGGSSVALWEVGRTDRQGADLLTITDVAGSTRWVDKVAVSPDGALLAADTVTSRREGVSSQVTVWDLRERRVLGDAFPGGDGLAFGPGGKLLAVREAVAGAGPRRVVVWDVATHNAVGQPFVGARGVAFNPDGRSLAVARDDGTILLWDVVEQKEIGALPARPSPAQSPGRGSRAGPRTAWLAFGPDGRTLSVGQDDDLVTRWALGPDPRVMFELRTGASATDRPAVAISDVEFSPDGRVAVVSRAIQGDLGIYGNVSLWDVPAGKRLGSRDGAVTDAAFAADGKTFVTADATGVVSLWDVDRLRPLDAPVFTQRELGAVALSRDGLLAVGSPGGVALSTTAVAAWRDAACGVFGASLTESEWAELIGSARPYTKTCSKP